MTVEEEEEKTLITEDLGNRDLLRETTRIDLLGMKELPLEGQSKKIDKEEDLKDLIE